MKILVVIVTYNAMQWAEHCFESLRKSTIVPDVYVVDNGSTDGTQAYIQQTYPEAKFIQSKENLGFGKANNIGLQYALDNDYDYVYLLNQDAWIFEETLSQLANVQKRYPQYGILSPLQCQANVKHVDAHFGRCITNYGKNFEVIDDVFLANMEEVYEVPFVMAAHWLISRDCLRATGGFSPTFAHYGEDGNYIQRAIYHGYKIGYSPKALAVHDRENRKTALRKRVQIQKMGYYCIFSNPNHGFLPSLKVFIGSIARNMVKTPTLLHVNSICSLICRFGMIRKNRDISIRETTAFLENRLHV